MEVLKTENQRLKDENGALIRVISKLSKWLRITMKGGESFEFNNDHHREERDGPGVGTQLIRTI